MQMRKMYFACLVGPVALYTGYSRAAVHDAFKRAFLSEVGFTSTSQLNMQCWEQYINLIRDWWWWDVHQGNVEYILAVAWEIGDCEQIDCSAVFE